jgi:septin family protein
MNITLTVYPGYLHEP